jgi:hypothetical protein
MNSYLPKKMKTIVILLCGIISLSSCSQKPVFNQTAGNLRFAIDNTGKIIVLENIIDHKNYLAPEEACYLLEYSKYGTDSVPRMLKPESMKIAEKNQAGTKVELAFRDGVKLTVLITPKTDYFRMELVDAAPVAEFSQITWGPYKTSMRGQIGEWLGLNRSDDFTIGLLTLEPNTDGLITNYFPISAAYTKKGSMVQL